MDYFQSIFLLMKRKQEILFANKFQLFGMVPYSLREKTFKLNLFEVIYSILCAILYVYCFYTASCRYPTMKFPTICLIGKFWSRASRRRNCISHFSFFRTLCAHVSGRLAHFSVPIDSLISWSTIQRAHRRYRAH